MRSDAMRRSLLVFVLVGLVAAGYACRSAPPPIVYYTLDPLPLQAASPSMSTTAAPLRIGVGPVRLPTYLERAQIVTRSGDHTLAVNDVHRWAGPLDEEILRVLVVSVGEALPGAEVLPFPWGRRYQPTHQVRLNLQRFDGQPGGSVHLRGSWQLTCPQDEGLNTGRAFDIVEAVGGAQMKDLVAAQNRALAALTTEIVAALCEGS